MNPAPGPDRSWLAVVLAAGAVRLIAAALVPVFPEEAYHWCYARHLSPGYYDHPPMIAWMIAAGRLLFGDTALGVRVVTVLASVVTHAAVGGLSRRLHGAAAARWTALLLAVQPAMLVGSAFAFPDAPLLMFWSLAAVCLMNALDSGRGGWWLATGAAWGGALLSKYTACFFAASVLVALAAMPSARRWLRTPWPYLAAIAGVVVFSPVLYWNATHDWASFRFQAAHRFEEMEGPRLSGGLKFLAGQWGALLPLTLPLAGAAVAAALRRRSASDVLLLCLSLPTLAFFFVIGFTRATHVFWPLGAYLALTVLMGEAAARGTGRVASAYRHGGAWVLGSTAAAILLAIVDVVHPLPRIPAMRGLYDWEAIAAQTRRLREGLPAGSFVLGVGKRYLCAAQLAFHLQDPESVQAKNLLGGDGLQFAYWARPDALRNHDAVVVAEENWSPDLEDLLRSRFRTVERAGEWTTSPGGRPTRERYVFYVARGFSPP